MRVSLFVQPSGSLAVFWILRLSTPTPSFQLTSSHFSISFSLRVPRLSFLSPLLSSTMASFRFRSNNLDRSKGALLLRHLSSAENSRPGNRPKFVPTTQMRFFGGLSGLSDQLLRFSIHVSREVENRSEVQKVINAQRKKELIKRKAWKYLMTLNAICSLNKILGLPFFSLKCLVNVVN